MDKFDILVQEHDNIVERLLEYKPKNADALCWILIENKNDSEDIIELKKRFQRIRNNFNNTGIIWSIQI